MEHQHYRNVVAIEVKSGTDVSNIHNRIGEAEKSHQKARQRSFTECWTVVNVGRLDMAKARSESPSTDRFYSLAALSLQGWRRIRRLPPPCAVADGHSCRTDEPVSPPLPCHRTRRVRVFITSNPQKVHLLKSSICYTALE